MVSFCTFARELKNSFSEKINNPDIVNLLLNPQLDGLEDQKITKSRANNLMSGRQKVPEIISRSLSTYDYSKLKEYVSSNIIQLIDQNKQADLLDGLADIVENDPTLELEEANALYKYIEAEDFSDLITSLLRITLNKTNTPTEEFIHHSPELAPWPEMPDFSGYISRITSSFSKVRTLLYHDEEKKFYDFYICNALELHPLFMYPFRFDSNVYDYLHHDIKTPSLKILSGICNYGIITGTGGLGKSMMMRNLLLTSASSYKEDGMIPVFIPLKDYTSEDIDLFDYIYERFTDGGKFTDISHEQFIDTLKHNRFQLLLDGYDELKSNCVDAFEKSLRKFIRKYPNNTYVMSSRPFDPHETFKRFISYELVPFTKDQSLALIEKLEFRPDDPSIKTKFAQQLSETLYDTHHEFASNPLLLTIMLMTFEQFAEVPSKMHVFYREAYATLSQKHDASKGAYKRALRTGLSADNFSDYFAEFCARTYTDEKYEISREEIENYFNKLSVRKKDERATFTASDFIYDLQHNLCLLYHESGKYHFTHRSFQEYFCALYFSHQKDKVLERIGESFEKRSISSSSDKTFIMLYDMIPEKVEEYIFLPYLRKLFSQCSGVDDYWIYLTKYVKSLTTDFRYRSRSFLNSHYTTRVPFIRGFILNSVIKRKRVSNRTDFPYYKEFVREEYDKYETPNGTCHLVPASYSQPTFPIYEQDKDGNEVEVKYEDLKISKEYTYMFPFAKIAKNREAYPDLVEFFESDNFQPYVDFYALKDYYEQLKKSTSEAEDDSLDFL